VEKQDTWLEVVTLLRTSAITVTSQAIKKKTALKHLDATNAVVVSI
jgi:hypothetical protein